MFDSHVSWFCHTTRTNIVLVSVYLLSNMYSYQTMGKVDSLSGWMPPKIRITLKKASNKSCSELNFIQKKNPRVHMCISHKEWSYGARIIDMVKIWCCTEIANYIQFRVQRCQKYASHPKKLQIKIVWNWISYKKVHERTCLISPMVWSHGAWKTDMIKIWRTEITNYIQFKV